MNIRCLAFFRRHASGRHCRACADCACVHQRHTASYAGAPPLVAYSTARRDITGQTRQMRQNNSQTLRHHRNRRLSVAGRAVRTVCGFSMQRSWRDGTRTADKWQWTPSNALTIQLYARSCSRRLRCSNAASSV